MRHLSIGAALLIIPFLVAPASAENSTSACPSYVGTTVAPLTFDEAVAKLPKVSPKGEFETTAEYQARFAAAGGGGLLIVGKAPDDRKFFTYDADHGKLSVEPYAFRNWDLSAWYALHNTAGLEPSTLYNVDVVISRGFHIVGSYMGQNGFGAQARIVERQSVVHAIYDRPIGVDEELKGTGLFLNNDEVVGTLDMPPSEAQALKPKLSVAFVVLPKEPYLVHSHYKVGEPTIDAPIDETEIATVMIADIRCGLLLDGSNKVIGAYPTR